jgi:hypothetical protein
VLFNFRRSLIKIHLLDNITVYLLLRYLLLEVFFKPMYTGVVLSLLFLCAYYFVCSHAGAVASVCHFVITVIIVLWRNYLKFIQSSLAV